MKPPLLICPGFFGARLDGIGRVTGAFARVLEQVTGCPPYVLASNDPIGAALPKSGRCFARNYRRMLFSAAIKPRALTGPEIDPPAGADRWAALPIVCTHLGLSPVARLLAWRTRRRYVVFIHGIEAWRPLPARSRWGVKGAARLFVNSHYTLNRFRACNPWAAARPATVIPLGVPVAELEAAVEPVRRPADPFVILTVGRMAKGERQEGHRNETDLYKGYKTVIDALERLRNADVPAVLEVVGDGDARSELERWAASRPAAPWVRFRGRVSDAELTRHYAEADAFVLPSEGEGFGLVFAEAMAHGVPCIGVAAGAAPEVITHDESGYIVRVRDSHEIADRLHVLFRNPRVQARLQAGAKARYEAHFTQQAWLRRIAAALREMMPGPAPAGADEPMIGLAKTKSS